MNLRETIARELERLGQDELKLALTFVRALASPASSRKAKMEEWLALHYTRAIEDLRSTELPQKPDEFADSVAQRAAEALEKMWAIARARGITDEDALEEVRAYRASRRNQQQGYSQGLMQ
jgi:16S rRNA C967 or C1407 C5-methylase (RsmB/RsmF family)